MSQYQVYPSCMTTIQILTTTVTHLIASRGLTHTKSGLKKDLIFNIITLQILENFYI